MIWDNFLTYDDSPQNAFETLCNQLFERHLKSRYGDEIVKFRVINGAGGDGGIEAYGELRNGEIIAVQSKYFRTGINVSQINQIRKSIKTAIAIRSKIVEYIICVPRDLNSKRFVRGKKGEPKQISKDDEETKIDAFIEEAHQNYPDLTITWWFENDIIFELQKEENEGVLKFWFDREIITMSHLKNQFAIQKKGWLKPRYISDLHTQGTINYEYQEFLISDVYQRELFEEVGQAVKGIELCIKQLQGLLSVYQNGDKATQELNNLKDKLSDLLSAYREFISAVRIHNIYFKGRDVDSVDTSNLRKELQNTTLDKLKESKRNSLFDALERIEDVDLAQELVEKIYFFKLSAKLILGKAGAGKTHGLANCVEMHLNSNMPAVIIQAKKSPCDNWTKILSSNLELSGWNKNEILSAFETLTIRNDTQLALKAGVGADTPANSTVLICVDGLDEASDYESWYARIRESSELSKIFPRLRFFFSGRKYFYHEDELPKSEEFISLELSPEGDVPIFELAPKYLNEYNIKLSDIDLIKGIDSPLSLKLFCERYKGEQITNATTLVTATKDLLNGKIDRLGNEVKGNLGVRGRTRTPVKDTLIVVASHFYENAEIEHDNLAEQINKKIHYLNTDQVDQLIDYLADNGFLIKFHESKEEFGIGQKVTLYSIAYQSIVEHMIAQKICSDIKSKKILGISQNNYLGNWKILQHVVDAIFFETGNLIGEVGFRLDGIPKDMLFTLQMQALVNAPYSLAEKYKEQVDDVFLNSGHKARMVIFRKLILPSSYSNRNFFGANYLHKKLVGQSSTFEKDKFWLGLDRYEKDIIQPADSSIFDLSHLDSTYYEVDSFYPDLSDIKIGSYQKHDELPLVCAWGLSTLNQKLRRDLRVELTKWAMQAPLEFLQLLEKIFHCKDPQIQEDLASITLGVACKLKKESKEDLKALAEWAIENIFSNLKKRRNVIVRQGFRSIIERAFIFGMVSDENVKLCRPRLMGDIDVLPIELNPDYKDRGDECYPIVHDLGWYVIKKAYNPFLDYKMNSECEYSKKILKKYEEAYGEYVGIPSFGISAALAYIKGLGFLRTEGNGYTQATHGSKSKVFTYEEKYTWLAVHYLQGYLSDFVPLKRGNKNDVIIDYSQLSDIPNPSEYLKKNNFSKNLNRQIIIKENLYPELDYSIPLKQGIVKWVEEELSLDFEKWLSFSSNDLNLESNQNWLALHNFTTLCHDQEVYSSIVAYSCLVKQSEMSDLIEIVKKEATSGYSNIDVDRLRSSPDIRVYCNPSDLAWMNWIEDEVQSEKLWSDSRQKEILLDYMVSKVTKRTVEGEKFITIASKKLRDMLRSFDLNGSETRNQDGELIFYNHKVDDDDDDRQDLLLVDQEKFQGQLDGNGSDIVWFVQVLKRSHYKIAERIGDDRFHNQKVIKYLVSGRKEIFST